MDPPHLWFVYGQPSLSDGSSDRLQREKKQSILLESSDIILIEVDRRSEKQIDRDTDTKA